jgi:hypothetical protein
MRRALAGFAAAALALSSLAMEAAAQSQAPEPILEAADTALVVERPFVEGGYDDKPYLTGLFGRISLGGYVEANAFWTRADGVTDEASFALQRWNLLTSSRVGDHIQVWAEVEFEDGGSEIILELAQVDLELHHAANLRGGMLLLPLGYFNLAHDGPRNPFVDRPLLATDLLGTALSMPGFGLFGRFPFGEDARVTYEAYAVNGYADGLLLDSPDGTRLPLGAQNPEDANASPALVSRLAWSPMRGHELGVSGYTGAYNVFRVDGLEVDDRRAVRVAVVDARTSLLGLVLSGEFAAVSVDIPAGLEGLYASRQAAYYLDCTLPFGRGWFGTMPDAFLSAGVRLEAVDMDRGRDGDATAQVTAGVNFHPSSQSALKLDYVRNQSRDRFNNAAQGAAVKLSLTTYF